MAFISALIIQQDYIITVNSDGTFGFTSQIPTPLSGGKIDCDYWAVPVVGQGFVSDGFKYIPCQPADTIKPDVQAFHVVRILSFTQSTVWTVYGTSLQYNAASYDAETGHSSTPVLMPVPTSTLIPMQLICNQGKSTGLYTGTFAAPTYNASKNYFATGYFNAAALPALSGSGYSTMAALIAAMNSNWSIAGVWTSSADNLTVILTEAASAVGTDLLGVTITVA